MRVPAGWSTSVEVLRLGGSVIEEHTDHLVVRTPRNPGFHWGNFVLVGDPASADDADRWLEVFDDEFPDAEHVAVGLPVRPASGSWRGHGLTVEADLVLGADQPSAERPIPEGYEVRRLVAADDWVRFVAADVAENRITGHHPEAAFRDYATRLAAVRAEMVTRGVAAFMAAFTVEGFLAARAGIVLCAVGQGAHFARYQHVGTHPDHRGRGLAGHLLGAAGRWAQQVGAERWEIHVEEGSAAHRLYRDVGFGPVGRAWQAHLTDGPEAFGDRPEATDERPEATDERSDPPDRHPEPQADRPGRIGGALSPRSPS